MPAMNSNERIYLRLERPGFPCDIAGVFVLEPGSDAALRFDQVRALFDQRCHRSPVLTLMLAPAPMGIGEDRWTQADRLDIDAHLHHKAVPAPGDTDALLATVLEVSKDPLDRSRPLWEAWYLTGLADGAAALVLRNHHATLDGTGLMHLHQILLDTRPVPVDLDELSTPVQGRRFPSLLRRAVIEVPNRLATQATTTGRIVKNVVAAVPQTVVGKPIRSVQEAAPGFGSLQRLKAAGTGHLPALPGYIPSPSHHPPMTVFNQHVDDPTKTMAVISLPLEQVKQVRRAFPDVTVNDILFALVTGALRDYLTAIGDLPTGPMRTTCPVNIRAVGDRRVQGNQVTTMWIDLPVHLSDPSERLSAVSASFAAAKASLPETRASWQALADVGDLLFPWVVSAAMAFAGSRVFGMIPPTQNLTVSTLPASAEPLYLGTQRITHMYARMITCPPIHLFFQALTYAGTVDFSVTTLRQLCPDPERLAEGLRAELDRLAELAP